MMYPGCDLKFRVTSTQMHFEMGEDNFGITIKNQFGRVMWRIEKRDCIIDTEGHFYFVLENVPGGVYTAIFAGSFEDEDYNKQERVFFDIQHLAIVPGERVKHIGPHKVQYDQVWTVSIDGADYLADSNGHYIYTSDGHRIQFISQNQQTAEDMGKVMMHMTGDEFLKLIEGRSPDSEINTLPEVFDALRGITDKDSAVKEDVQDQIDDNECGDSDIDEIFPDEE